MWVLTLRDLDNTIIATGGRKSEQVNQPGGLWLIDIQG